MTLRGHNYIKTADVLSLLHSIQFWYAVLEEVWKSDNGLWMKKEMQQELLIYLKEHFSGKLTWIKLKDGEVSGETKMHPQWKKNKKNIAYHYGNAGWLKWSTPRCRSNLIWNLENVFRALNHQTENSQYKTARTPVSQSSLWFLFTEWTKACCPLMSSL